MRELMEASVGASRWSRLQNRKVVLFSLGGICCRGAHSIVSLVFRSSLCLKIHSTYNLYLQRTIEKTYINRLHVVTYVTDGLLSILAIRVFFSQRLYECAGKRIHVLFASRMDKNLCVSKRQPLNNIIHHLFPNEIT